MLDTFLLVADFASHHCEAERAISHNAEVVRQISTVVFRWQYRDFANISY
ncbi:hypothetical protein HMPREF0970_01048 [Schaalia odontolytica F0309]|uniref:Uncharacterized protein n=1 Tax=Schaalia odontolytica F0309 TaxID=649742 RepID=D4TYM2_9ACTO|nr:hypothetical protein HMPREF0970_01048 [Schaalia odontolytica F0309]